VSEIAVYVEGGGHTVHLQAELRRGFDVLLRSEKESARRKRCSLKLVCCGGRQETYRAFKNEIIYRDEKEPKVEGRVTAGICRASCPTAFT